MEHDQVDLSEAFFMLWSKKVFIAIVTCISLIAAGQYLTISTKKYVASASFQLDLNNSRGGISLPSEFGALAALVGAGSKSANSSDLIIERATEREFILLANEKLDFETDPFFNPFDPNEVDAAWKKLIKIIIGWQNFEGSVAEITEENLLISYREFVQIITTEAGAFSIKVTHSDPDLASKYANGIMNLISELVSNEEATLARDRMNYLSMNLASSLTEMENAQKAVAEFIVKNSANPQETLMANSSKLKQLRSDMETVKRFLAGVRDIQKIVRTGPTENDYQKLKATHPLIDDVKFRRIVGISETISEWSWPSFDNLNRVTQTLQNRINRLSVEINKIYNEAGLISKSVEEFANLTRNAAIAEATYTVMMEQVKAQSLATGYRPDTFKAFKYATPPIAPAKPNRILVLILSILLGIFIGCAAALISGMRKSVYFTRSALSAAVNATHALRIGTMRRLSRLPLSVLSDRFSKRSHLQLDDLLLDMGESKLILVTSSHSRITSSGVARLITASAAKARRRVLLCDTSWSSNEAATSTTSTTDFITVPSIDGVDVLVASPDLQKSNVYTLQAFKAFVEKSMTSYDHVIVSGNDEYGKLAAKALKSLEPSVVFAARIGKTKKYDIAELTATMPVEVLLHD